MRLMRFTVAAPVRATVWAVAAAGALALIACLVPLRWDVKSFGAVLPRGANTAIPSGRNVVLVTADEDEDAGHLVGYGLDLLTLPNGRRTWVTFHEDRGD